LSTLQATLSSLLRRQQRDLEIATRIAPAPTLRSEQRNALDALSLRVDGLAGLRRAFDAASTTPAQLSFVADRLVTSDVIWRDFFQEQVQAQLALDGAHGARAPSSTFLAEPDLATSDSMAALLDRLRHRSAQTGPTLKLGSSGPAVSAWQSQLNRWLRRSGHARLAVTGRYDNATEQGTVRLQQSEGITADGVVGPVTRAALTKALAS